MADILIVNGEVIWDGDDIAVIEGEEDIRQQAYLRSIADEGESEYYPSYGSNIYKFVGKPYSLANKALTEQAARDALLKVTDIEEVLSLSFNPVTVETEAGKRVDYYICAEYKTTGGNILKEDYSFVAE